MAYFASFYRKESRTNSSTVLLQEVFHLRRGLQVFLGVVYVPQEQSDSNRRISGCFLQWFYGEGAQIISRKGVRGMEKLLSSFCSCLKEIECRRVPMAGILTVENQCIMFGKGPAQIYILNRGHHGPECAPLYEKNSNDDMWIQTGNIGENVGILLTSESLCEEMLVGGVSKTLDVMGIQCPEQAERALKQLGGWATENGQHHLTTLLIVRKE